jgi:hypothetical protein
MVRLLVIAGVVLLMTSSARAQSYCAHVRLAVATYGYEASKRHALANYGKAAVEAGEKCLKGRDSSPKSIGPDGQASGASGLTRNAGERFDALR